MTVDAASEGVEPAWARGMQTALRRAQRGLEGGEAPIACVLLDAQGAAIGEGHNTMHATGVVTAHAEINAFVDAGRKIEPGGAYTMITTLEPCVMCLGAAMQAGVTTVVFGLRAPADAGSDRLEPPQSPQATAPALIGPICEEENRTLFSEWLARHRGDPSRAAQQQFIEQLLAIAADAEASS